VSSSPISATSISPPAGTTLTEHSPKSSLQAWVRALERTAPIERNPHVTLPIVIEQLAGRLGAAPALIGAGATLTYRSLAELARRYARWAIAEGFAGGDVVCLLMESCPEYLAIWLGLTRAGLTVSLLNTRLTGESLAHGIRIVSPRALIAGAGMGERLRSLGSPLAPVRCWAHGEDIPGLPRVDLAAAALAASPLEESERALPSLDDRALYIYTSGTTGLPKAAVVSHARVMQWTHWFAGLMDIRPEDRMYNCLPLYHSVGGVVAAGAPLVAGAAVVLRERFSASRFWPDVRDEGCTLFQYIGELCRYLLASPPGEAERAHRLRLACGNGLRAEVWTAFQSRFRIPRILEYYAATEANFSLYNCEGRPGAIGRIPPFLSHRYPVALVRSDEATGAPLRDARGRCIRCERGEPGEAISQIAPDANGRGARFEGYADPEASERKVLRDVFESGDAWYRSGDLMRRDAEGFFYFLDRIGDTFRWKGENVSTTEVAALLGTCPGVAEVAVFGVAVRGTEGRAGMAALVVDEGFDWVAFRRHVTERLPAYARPLFLRRVEALDATGTFRLKKQALAAEGYDPARIRDELYFDDAEQGAYVPLDAPLYERLMSGRQRL
jgi:fatty-acyl-CoA synthase